MFKRFWVTGFIFLFITFKSSILNASTLSATQNLSFGTLSPINSSGSVILSSSGTLTTGGNVQIITSGTAITQGRVRYTGTGLSSTPTTVNVSLLSSSVTLNNGGATVIINNFTYPTSFTVSSSATVYNINIGATMNYTAASIAGAYTGSVTVRTTRGTEILDRTLPIRLTFWKTLTISQIAQLHFGSMEVSTGNSVVRINPQTGARTIISGASGINLLPTPTPLQAQFDLTGQKGKTVAITMPSSITLTGSNGGSMVVNNFTRYPSVSNPALSSSNGKLTLRIGADLNVGTSQQSGTYTGTYSIIVNY